MSMVEGIRRRWFSDLGLVTVLFAATCPVSSAFHDGYVDQKWCVTLIVVLALTICALLRSDAMRPAMWNVSSASMLITLYIVVYAYAKYCCSRSALAGVFENPNVMALHLCLLLPFVCQGRINLEMRNTVWWFYLIAELLSVGTILLSGCRTAWLCLVVFYAFTFLRGSWKLAGIPFALAIAFLLATFVKTPSTHGRYFIARNAIGLIAEAPLTGHGANGFDRAYMPRQAEYFRHHSDPEAEMLADDIHHPLNEFLLVGVNYGAIGIAVLALLLSIPLLWKRRLYDRCRPLWMCLVVLLVFCLFGYPLLYPLSWLLLANCWFMTFSQHLAARWTMRFNSVLLPVAVGLFIMSVVYTGTLLAWGYASQMAKRGHSAMMMPIYKKLHPCLSWRGIFLYDYAIESLYADRNEQAYRLAEECRERYVSYDLALLEGDICQYLHLYDAALAYYDEASNMCPVRFAPLYGKWQVYKKTNREEEMDSVSILVLHKSIKVNSQEVQMIIKEIKK